MSREPPDPTCVVCFDKANTVLYPCGHLCLCQSCSEQLSKMDTSQIQNFKWNFKERKGMSCPMCRRKGLPTIVYKNMDT